MKNTEQAYKGTLLSNTDSLPVGHYFTLRMTSSNFSDTTRATQRLQWIRTTLADSTATLQRASSDAGFRSYWRSTSNGLSHILMDAPPHLENPHQWLRIHALLTSGGVRVPHILAQDLEAGFLLLEDLGIPTLAQRLDADNADALFDAALDQLIALQCIVPPNDLPRFNTALLERDASLFEDWFLYRHLNLTLNRTDLDALKQVQQQLMDNALTQPRVLVHRDFMPRNLMLTTDGVTVLDFQDCTVGPVAYDPVSLFKDTSVSWPLARVDRWLTHYHARANAAKIPVQTLPHFLRDADWMGVQRHLKNLGVFARLHYRDGKSWYLENVPRFISYLEEILPRHPTLAPLAELIEHRIKPALAARIITEST
ncbi:aminoglycoside phosphotransferase family protein [Xylella fastidiosa]|uniref:aminoglycoside phosphotransferase family protein n=1 Tax=Xylella fastidiosa TaxID=2371 RepID=UPI003CE56729